MKQKLWENTQMSEWFKTSLGRSIIDAEIKKCGQLIPSQYYGSGLQVGMTDMNYLDTSEVRQQFLVDILWKQNKLQYNATEHESGSCFRVASSCDALPFPERSQGLVILPHTLDFCKYPHTVLRQVNQILAPEGCLAIIGFNAASLFGLLKFFKKSNHLPWSGHYYSVGRVQDWISLLGYDLIGAGMMAYSPPMQSDIWRQRTAFLEHAGNRWWPGLGGVYVIVGKKREIPITAEPSIARSWQRLIPGIPQTTSGTAFETGGEDGHSPDNQ